MKKRFLLASGFTLIEMILVMSVLLILFSLISINLVHSQRRASLNTVIDTLVTDMKSQQTRAMVGDTQGRTSTDVYGVYISSDSYTLFHGNSYSAGAADNYVITLDPSLQFENPNYSIIFSRMSGSVVGYNPLANNIVVQDTSNNEQKTIHFNQYGVITAVD